jgi:hypothetical protein
MAKIRETWATCLLAIAGLSCGANAAPGGAAGLEFDAGDGTHQLPLSPTDEAAEPNPTGNASREECSNLSRFAYEQARDALNAVTATQCQTDSDCRSYETADWEACWSNCAYDHWGSSAYEAAERAAVNSDTVLATCRVFREAGCKVLPVGCPAPEKVGALRCTDNQCAPVFE